MGVSYSHFVCYLLYPVQLESDRMISVIPVDFENYEKGDYALYRITKEEGMPI